VVAHRGGLRLGNRSPRNTATAGHGDGRAQTAVSSIFQQSRRAEVIPYRRATVEICNCEALERTSCACYMKIRAAEVTRSSSIENIPSTAQMIR
jgi:hypothetical protein